MGDWSNLPIDIIRLIFERMEFLSDIQRFAFVCLTWRSVTMESHHLFNPLLIFSYEEDSETCNLYDPIDEKVFKLHLPELHNKRCCGASGGWLITLDNDLVVRLLHPFSRAQVLLPPLTPLSPRATDFLEGLIEGRPGNSHWKSCFVQKVIISSNPLNPDCIFVKIGGQRGEISFCRATDDTWTVLDRRFYYSPHFDAIFYEGRLYVTHNGYPFVWDISSNTLEGYIAGPPHSDSSCNNPGYFVLLSGDLLHVIRHQCMVDLHNDPIPKLDEEVAELSYVYKAVRFEVFKLTHKGEDAFKPKTEPWERITCLGDHALFVGRSQSFLLPAPRFPGYRGNCIYFTDHSEGGLCYHDMGEFNLEDGSIRFFDLDGRNWPPVWFKQH